MATRIQFDLSGGAKAKKELLDTANAVRPLSAALEDAAQQSRLFKDVAENAVHATAQEYRKLAYQIQGVKWNEFVAEMTVAAKTEQALAGTTAGLSGQYQSLTGSVNAATAAKQRAAAASRGLAGSNQLATQAGYALQDALAGGETGGVAGALRGAANNLSLMASTLGGPWGIAIGAAITALPILITLFNHFGKETEDGEEKTLRFTDALRKLADETERAKEIRNFSSGEGASEVKQLQERQALVKKILQDQSVGDEARQQANEEFHRLQAEIEQVQLRVTEARKSENAALEENRTRLASVLGEARELSQVLNEQAQFEKEAAKARLESALNSDSTEEIADAFKEVSSSLDQSLDRMKRLRDELNSTKDASKAANLAGEMRNLAHAIGVARNNLAALDQQYAKADAAEQRAKAEKAINDRKRAEEKEAREKADAEELAAAKAQQQRLEDAVSGGGAADELLKAASDPMAIAKRLSENAGQQAFDKSVAGGASERDAEKARKAAAAEAFGDARRQAAGGFQTFSQDEISGAIEQNANAQLQQLQASGGVSAEAVAALGKVTNEQIALSQEQEFQRQQIEAINAALNANAQAGNRRRAQNTQRQ